MNNKSSRSSAFEELGLKKSVEHILEEIIALYFSDEIPWVVGYSGGKDSTAVLQLVWQAVKSIPNEKRTKKVHVISTDTLVENPIVAKWVDNSLEVMKAKAVQQKLPFEVSRLTPTIKDSFWVNLIGKGYPAPRHKFRWCTERMKINPSNLYITNVVRQNGEAILILGTRKAESASRAGRMKKLEAQRVRERLSPNRTMPNCYVFSPIEEWNNDDVWLFLMQYENPWGYNNKDLLTLYSGASPDGECPLVIDTSTPSCGDSRFGCWVCTMVDKDKSMAAMIQNDQEKQWMLPLLRFRDFLDIKDDRKHRDFRRMNGQVQVFYDSNIPGPYTQDYREFLLSELLKAQVWIQNNGPNYMEEFRIISQGELDEIRRVWVIDKHELEDMLPKIYENVIGRPYNGVSLDDYAVFSADDFQRLKEVCGENRLQYELTRELIDIERKYRNSAKRNGLYEALEKAFKKHFYEGEDDAVALAIERKVKRENRELSI